MVVISSSLKKVVTSTDLVELLIENIHIKSEHVTTFLGIFIDENLFWK